MSRLTQPPITDGDALDAASLNDRFTQFTQSGTLNAFNTRDAAFDLPAFKYGNTRFLAKNLAVGTIGQNDWKHGAYRTYTGQTTGASPYTVETTAPAATPLSFGPLGFTLSANVHVLRVYWDLSVRPRWEGTKPWEGGATFFTFNMNGGGTDNVFSGYGCWAFWLQWDITSNALTNFENVPGQGDFNGNTPGTSGPRGGNTLANCQSTSVVQSVIEYGDSANEGKPQSIVTHTVGWTTTDGAWHYVRPDGAADLTVYGVRVVFSGPFGAHNNANVNYLVRNDSVAASARLDVQAGSLQALLMRTE